MATNAQRGDRERCQVFFPATVWAIIRRDWLQSESKGGYVERLAVEGFIARNPDAAKAIKDAYANDADTVHAAILKAARERVSAAARVLANAQRSRRVKP